MYTPRNALKAVSYAMARNDKRYYLNGMRMECNGDTVRLVATDGARMHLMDIEQKGPAAPLPAGVIMPRELVDWALKNSTKRAPGITVRVVPTPPADDGTARPPVITVTAGGASMSAPAVDGRFPDYGRVIPRDLTGETGQFNPRYVLDAYLAVLELAPSAAPELQHNGEGPALMTFDRFAAVIMPWRCSEDAIDARLLAPVGAAIPEGSEVAS